MKNLFLSLLWQLSGEKLICRTFEPQHFKVGEMTRHFTCGLVTITRVVPTGGGEYQIWGK